ncbi:GGDEF domain-containing protein|uniref:sensor domain-containing diguanylate cyclase n=1 Tax=Stenotrophomonas sp. SbOxS2 TaxID=2723885 RepID=UPI0015D1734E|nr:sensor domain-containing diguanylate cyclase [Stenotrophomonas sp. SbOxS2]NYT99464.1 GGDEF domain-containing protein [Stenotrophomonas sp. SbOxS2]
MNHLDKRITLQGSIVLLGTFSALAMLFNALVANYQVQKSMLVENTLESNRVYAAKLAQTTSYVISSARERLAYSASLMASNFNSMSFQYDEVRRLKNQGDVFNSVVVVSHEGRVLSSSPQMEQLNGKLLKSSASEAALSRRIPMVSDPFVSASGRMLLVISHPIFGENGQYSGYIAATIYLKERNILHEMLDAHYYRDGSYVYVIDKSGKILYHPNSMRIGESVSDNPVVDAVAKGRAGAMQILNSEGKAMLSGFAPVPEAGWGVVTQRPLELTLQPLKQLMIRVVLRTTPFAALTLLSIWLLARWLSSPLSQLALNTHARDVGQAIVKVKAVTAWYFEAAQLKLAVLNSFKFLQERIGKLNLATLTDPLTGLFNRRGLEEGLADLKDTEASFAAIAIDIDHFKAVNDVHGHAAGDTVIAELSSMMRLSSREGDLLCRAGGEEFLMLLPHVVLRDAVKIAERIRSQVNLHHFSVAGCITVSIGVSHYPGTNSDPDLTIRQADKALYLAKSAGRNRVVTHPADS